MGSMDFPCAMVDQVMPMHLLVSSTGHIERVGPSLQKLRPEFDFVGRRVLEIFELNHKAQTPLGFAELSEMAGQKIRLSFRGGDRTRFKGMVVPLMGFLGLGCFFKPHLRLSGIFGVFGFGIQ